MLERPSNFHFATSALVPSHYGSDPKKCRDVVTGVDCDRQEVMDDHFFTESEKGNRWRTTEMVDGDEVFLIAQKGDTWTAAFLGMYSM